MSSPNEGPSPETLYPMESVGNKVCFLKNVIKSPNIVVGDYTYYHDAEGAENFEANNVLYHESILEDKLIIGKFCQIAMGTRFIMNASLHEISGFSTYPFGVFSESWAKAYKFTFPHKGDTVAHNDVWFGYNSLIMPGLKIGDGAIIGTNSLVVKDVPPYTIVGGTPAKVIRKRFDDKTIEALLEIKWWDWPKEKIFAHLPEITGANIEALLKAAVT